jgi:hypothetical protein
MKKAFAQLKETKEDSDISESDSSQGESHFQATGDGLQFTQVESEFEPRIAQLLKQAHGSNMTLDLREIILLDSQSTVDLICNPNLVKKPSVLLKPVVLLKLFLYLIFILHKCGTGYTGRMSMAHRGFFRPFALDFACTTVHPSSHELPAVDCGTFESFDPTHS